MDEEFTKHINKFVKIVVKCQNGHRCIWGKVRKIYNGYLIVDATFGKQLTIPIKYIKYVL